MSQPKKEWPDLIPGTKHDLAIIFLLLVAGVYVATGRGSDQRWRNAIAWFGGPVAALYLMEQWKQNGEEKFEKGYTTYNPNLHLSDFTRPEAEQPRKRESWFVEPQDQ